MPGVFLLMKERISRLDWNLRWLWRQQRYHSGVLVHRSIPLLSIDAPLSRWHHIYSI